MNGEGEVVDIRMSTQDLDQDKLLCALADHLLALGRRAVERCEERGGTMFELADAIAIQALTQKGFRSVLEIDSPDEIDVAVLARMLARLISKVTKNTGLEEEPPIEPSPIPILVERVRANIAGATNLSPSLARLLDGFDQLLSELAGEPTSCRGFGQWEPSTEGMLAWAVSQVVEILNEVVVLTEPVE